MLETYDKLSLVILGDDEIEKYGQGMYKYLISNNNTSHTAFRTLNGVKNWLEITGLTVNNFDDRYQHINSQYSKNCILGYHYTGEPIFLLEKFKHIRQLLLTGDEGEYKSCKWLSNGNYTMGLIEKSEFGHIIHYLNPNEKSRIVYDYFWQ